MSQSMALNTDWVGLRAGRSCADPRLPVLKLLQRLIIGLFLPLHISNFLILCIMCRSLHTFNVYCYFESHCKFVWTRFCYCWSRIANKRNIFLCKGVLWLEVHLALYRARYISWHFKTVILYFWYINLSPLKYKLPAEESINEHASR